MSDDFEAEVRQEAAKYTEAEPEAQAPEAVEPSIEQEEEPPEEHVKNWKAAVKEERERRKAERDRADRLEETFRRFVEQTTQAQQPKAEAPKEKELPNPEEDLGGYLFAKANDLDSQLKAFKQRAEEEERGRQEYLRTQEIANKARVQAAEFAQKTPGYVQAYSSLMQDRARELGFMGVPETQIPNILANEEMMIINQAMQDGANPAERLYQIAKHRGLVKGSGTQSTNAKTMLEAAAKASTTSDLSVATPKGSMTLEQLASINDPDEFNKAWAKMMGR